MMSPVALDGTVCIVTGAGSGLGKAMALGLLEAGARVCALDVSPAGLTALRMAAQETPALLTLTADIRSEDDCASAVRPA